MQTVFEAVGGNDGLRRLAAGLASSGNGGRCGQPCLQPRLSPHISSDSPLTGPRHLEALAPYSDSYGDETTVVKMHSGNGERDEMDRRASCMLRPCFSPNVS